MLESVAVTKWLEPYVVLETFKKYFDCEDLTFDGFSKKTKLAEFYKKLENSNKSAVGLYLKNVNKFYVMTSESSVDVETVLLKGEFSLSESDYQTVETSDKAIEMVDMAKSEVSILMKK